MAISDIDEINKFLKGKIISRLVVNSAGQTELWYFNKKSDKNEAGYVLIVSKAQVLMQELKK